MRTVALVIVAAVLVAAQAAWATPVGTGDPVIVGSWGLPMHDSGNSLPIDHIQMLWLSGSHFELPNGVIPQSAGWSQTSNNGDLLVFEGPASGDVYWTNKLDDPQQFTQFHYAGYDGDKVVDSGILTFTPGSTTWSDDSGSAWEKVTGEAVPEPLTMLGVFAGVSGIGAYLRRRRVA